MEKNKMNKRDIIKAVALSTSLPTRACETIIDSFIEESTKCIISGKKLSFENFLIFDIKNNPERKGRNPKTGEEIIIPASKSVNCRISKNIKDALKNN